MLSFCRSGLGNFVNFSRGKMYNGIAVPSFLRNGKQRSHRERFHFIRSCRLKFSNFTGLKLPFISPFSFPFSSLRDKLSYKIKLKRAHNASNSKEQRSIDFYVLFKTLMYWKVVRKRFAIFLVKGLSYEKRTYMIDSM